MTVDVTTNNIAAAVITAAGIGLVSDSEAAQWRVHTTEQDGVTEYVLDMIKNPLSRGEADVTGDVISDEFIGGVRHVLDLFASVDGGNWYASEPDTGITETDARFGWPIVARVRFCALTDDQAVEDGLYGW